MPSGSDCQADFLNESRIKIAVKKNKNTAKRLELSLTTKHQNVNRLEIQPKLEYSADKIKCVEILGTTRQKNEAGSQG